MPELPEVETTKESIKDFVVGNKINFIQVYQPSLRYPIPYSIQKIKNSLVEKIIRRGKYLIFFLEKDILLLHLGMSGSLSIEKKKSPLKKHDHFEFFLSNDFILRYHDPRRFGLFLLLDKENYQKHFLLNNLGVEPLSKKWNSSYLENSCKNKKIAIKKFLMDSKIVVGIGNIYANETLFLAKVNPLKESFLLNKEERKKVIFYSKKILKNAIQIGGTTLRDYKNGEGKIGYFQQKLNIYNREGQPCKKCKTLIKKIFLSKRSTFFCVRCQGEIML